MAGSYTYIWAFSKAAAFRSMDYKSKRLRYLPAAFNVIRVLASAYPVSVDVIYPKLGVTKTVTLADDTPGRIASPGLADSCEVRVYTASEVSAVFLASTMEEIPV